MKVLGLDASLKCTGYAVYDTDKSKFVLVDKIHTSIKKATPTNGRRIEYITTQISQVIFWNCIDVVVIEDIYVGNNTSAAIPLGMLRGAILETVYGLDCGDLMGVTTGAMKKAVTGKGNASKEDTFNAVRALYGKQAVVHRALGTVLKSKDNLEKNEDMADAVGVVHSFISNPSIAKPA